MTECLLFFGFFLVCIILHNSERERERETDRQTGRQADRQTDGDRERQRQRETERERERECVLSLIHISEPTRLA